VPGSLRNFWIRVKWKSWVESFKRSEQSLSQDDLMLAVAPFAAVRPE